MTRLATAELTGVLEGRALDEAGSEALFHTIMTGGLDEATLVRFLKAQGERGPTVPEIIGAARAMRGQMRAVAAPADAIDLCGTGGDGLGTLNISTAVSFVVAAAGVPVAKHGNRSATSKSGAADILEVLGVKIGLEPERASAVLAQTGIVFLFAQTHHPAMRFVGAARKAVPCRTIFNLLGPLASPARVTRQLVGIYAREWIMPYAEALKGLGSRNAMVVHGADGLDEVTITDVTHAAWLKDGAIRELAIMPEDAGLKRAPLTAIQGGDARENAAALIHLFEGQMGPYHDIVCLNAAAALMVADRAAAIGDGVAIAADILAAGKAMTKLNDLIKASNTP